MSGFSKKYKVIRNIGAGQYATVVQVERKSDRQNFAVKVVDKKRYNLAEIDILARFNSPNLMYSIETYYRPDQILLVLPLMDTNLQSYVFKKNLSIDEMKNLMFQIASGLACLHEQYYHCDLKPDNILIKDGNAYISDFSLAYSKNIPDNNAICTAEIFRPPEYFIEKIPIDPAFNVFFSGYTGLSPMNDLWAYGCIVFYILAKKYFVENALDMELYLEDQDGYINSFVSQKEFVPFLKRLLAPNQDNRYQSAMDILSDPIFTGMSPYNCQIPSDYTGYQKDFVLTFPITEDNFDYITENSLFILFVYLLEVAYEYDMRAETFIFAIDLISRSMSQTLKLKELQLFGVLCIYIASELYETSKDKNFNGSEMILILNNQYTMKEIMEMYDSILQITDRELGEKTLYDYAKNLKQLKQVFQSIFDMGDELFTLSKDELEGLQVEAGSSLFTDFLYTKDYDDIKIAFQESNEHVSDINIYTVRDIFPKFK